MNILFRTLCIICLALSSATHGQKICGFIDNTFADRSLLWHEHVRSRTRAYTFNGYFIKNDIGLPPDSVWKYSNEEPKRALEWEEMFGPKGMDFIFNGVSYRGLRKIRSYHWMPSFVSLQNIKDRSYGKHIFNGICYFMFDDIYLPYDVKSYLFDAAYIDTVLVYRMGKREILRDACPEYDCKEAVVFRVFSKDYAKQHAHNAQDSLHPTLPRLRTQFEEDANRSAIFLNGTFVGSTFGLNLDSLTRIGGKNPYRVTVTQEPYEAGGVHYTSCTYIECKHYRPELVPLTTLKEKFPQINWLGYGDPVYIVENILIVNPQNVLIDKDYISVARGFLNNEIEMLPTTITDYKKEASGTNEGVIQVYVKNAEYVKELGITRIL